MVALESESTHRGRAPLCAGYIAAQMSHCVQTVRSECDDTSTSTNHVGSTPAATLVSLPAARFLTLYPASFLRRAGGRRRRRRRGKRRLDSVGFGLAKHKEESPAEQAQTNQPAVRTWRVWCGVNCTPHLPSSKVRQSFRKRNTNRRFGHAQL